MFLNVVDEFAKETLGTDIDRSMSADRMVRRLNRVPAQRRAPAYVCFELSPEFVAPAWPTGASSTAPVRLHRLLVTCSRAPGWSPSTIGCATSTCKAISWTASSRPRFSPRTAGSITDASHIVLAFLPSEANTRKAASACMATCCFRRRCSGGCIDGSTASLIPNDQGSGDQLHPWRGRAGPSPGLFRGEGRGLARRGCSA
jgi:hypothetical protein